MTRRKLRRIAVDDVGSLPMWVVLASVGVVAQHVVHGSCPFRASTGWDCPLCGGTRALTNVATFHGSTALRDNAALVLFGAVSLVLLCLRQLGEPVATAFIRKTNQWSPWVMVSVLVAWTLVRNLPGSTWLAPGR